jgi:hypothetical protein
MPWPTSARAAAFSGVLHLPGRLADAELGMDGDTDLMLTSAEFGDACLRNGWGSRHLNDLVRTHALVLVGHRPEDLPMRHRERCSDLKKVYAFAEAKGRQRPPAAVPLAHGGSSQGRRMKLSS